MPQTGLLPTKICRVCKEILSATDFYKHKNTKDKLKHECKSCFNKLTASYYFKNKDARVEQRKDYHYRKNYGLTKLEVEELKRKQNYRCAICNDAVDLVVDHNHESGKVRSLLCNKCNQGLGSFKDNSKLLDEASKYLRNKE